MSAARLGAAARLMLRCASLSYERKGDFARPFAKRLMTDAKDLSSLSFEQALAELEAIVQELESGQAPLEKSIEMYERGARLKAHCEARLEAARLKVEKIVVGPQGAAERA